MSYFDVMNAVNQYGKGMQSKFANTANNLNNIKFNSGPVNPSSSGAYVPQTARDIYGRTPDVYNPLEAFQDYKPYSGENLMMQGMQGLQYGTIAGKVSPYLQDFATSLGAKGTMASGGLGPAATLYGLTQNQNPYDFTQTERLGTIGSTVLGARALAPMISSSLAPATGATGLAAFMNPGVLVGSLLLGSLFSKKKKKKANKLALEARTEVEDAQQEGYDNRAEQVSDMRDQMLAQRQTEMFEQRSGEYDNQYGGNYNPYRADKGMKFTPKELKKIAKAGRYGDTMLAHVTPEESALLQALGGSGTTNPYTGLPEHFRFLKKLFGGATDVVRSVVDPVVQNIAEPVFDAVGNVADPIMGAASDVVAAGGDVATDAIKTGVDLGTDVLKAGGDISSDVLKASSKIINPILEPVMDVAMDVATPVMRGLHNLAQPLAGGILDLAKGGIEGFFDLTKGIGEFGIGLIQGFDDLLFGSNDPQEIRNPYQAEPPGEIQRETMEKVSSDPLMVTSEAPAMTGLKKRQDTQRRKVTEGDWVGDKPNPFTTPNVEEELDYANKGMKYNYEKGGKANIVAEFTGNELIVNDQDKLEKALASKNYSRAASSIRKAMKGGKITPGPETHKGNPMPVDDKGNIYAGGGALPFKVKKGAGIYDHATDQFKTTMTDKEIAMVAQKNMDKWKSNGMA